MVASMEDIVNFQIFKAIFFKQNNVFISKKKDDTFAKNEISQKWNRFNDKFVQEISESKLCVTKN